MKNFAIIGVGGYIAPRHIQAINDTGNRLVAATDVHDSVGVLDRYSQDVEFFKGFKKFEEFIKSLKGTQKQIDYLTICSPNYLHFRHIIFALENNCHAICEKPLVLTERELDEISLFEQKYRKKVYTVLQLRVHESILALKSVIDTNSNTYYNIKVDYITSRGPWYYESWKGDFSKSGGLAANIGVHFFDMLTWLFGAALDVDVKVSKPDLSEGALNLERAKVNWRLSINKDLLPNSITRKGMTTYRSITINGDEIEFSGGFADLHSKVYKEILDGNGYGVDHSREAIKILDKINNAVVK